MKTFKQQMKEGSTQMAEMFRIVTEVLDAATATTFAEGSAERMMADRMFDVMDTMRFAWCDIQSVEKDMRSTLDTVKNTPVDGRFDTRHLGFVAQEAGKLAVAVARFEQSQKEFHAMFTVGKAMGMWS